MTPDELRQRLRKIPGTVEIELLDGLAPPSHNYTTAHVINAIALLEEIDRLRRGLSVLADPGSYTIDFYGDTIIEWKDDNLLFRNTPEKFAEFVLKGDKDEAA